MYRQILIVVGIVLIGFLGLFLFKKQNQWILSLYRNGGTLLRIDYFSKEACLSAGRSYLADGSADRFDCGNGCSSFDGSNLTSTPVCKTICNASGCRN
jgi:LPXTG-motif cell wall-anchored protein